MTEQPTCDRCGRPVVDQSYVCDDDATRLADQLRLVSNLAGEAAVTVAKLDQISEGGYSTDTEVPLPVNLGAGNDHDAAVNTLTTWARHVHEASGRPLPTVRRDPCAHASCHARAFRRIEGPLCAGQPPEHPMAVVALWLVTQLDWIRHRQEAEQAFDEIDDACRVLVHVVDRPPERWYAGRCDECETDLYPVAGAKVIRCSECGQQVDLAERKTRLLDQAEDVLAGAAWCAATVTRLGLAVTAAAVRGYAHRHRLGSHGNDAMGRPLYRLGDVRALVLDQAAQDRVRELRIAIKAAEIAERKRKREDATVNAA